MLSKKLLKKVALVSVFAFCAPFALAANDSPVGNWRTIDDETNTVKSIVEITEKDGVFEGKVVKLFRKPEEDQNPLCDKCQGELNKKPILGLRIMWDLKKDSDYWDGGQILDPENGKTYKVKMHLVEDGTKLKVRGFIGFSFIGRTQVWERE